MSNHENLYFEVISAIAADGAKSGDEIQRAIALLEDAMARLRENFFGLHEKLNDQQKLEMNKCVTALQFDDILLQLLRGIRTRTDAREVMLKRIVDLDKEDSCSEGYEFLDYYLQETSGSASILQDSMERGSTELF